MSNTVRGCQGLDLAAVKLMGFLAHTTALYISLSLSSNKQDVSCFPYFLSWLSTCHAWFSLLYSPCSWPSMIHKKTHI